MSMLGFKRSARSAPKSAEMSLTEHLAELRMRIIRAGLAVFIGALVVFAFYNTVMGWLLEPYERLCQGKYDAGDLEYCGSSFDPTKGEVRLFSTDPIEGLSTRLKIGFYGGIILALPVDPVAGLEVHRAGVSTSKEKQVRHPDSCVSSTAAVRPRWRRSPSGPSTRRSQFLIGSASGPDIRPGCSRCSPSTSRLVGLMVAAFGVGFSSSRCCSCSCNSIGVLKYADPASRQWRYAIVVIIHHRCGDHAVAATPSRLARAVGTPMLVAVFRRDAGIGWFIEPEAQASGRRRLTRASLASS